ncbi:hypothetical protein BDD12DRAFT_756961 [Trichophaea hybrida]|nr:hypothetical protein BDD12DRAFT_756961 [Trichophaea hybrida]
MITTRHQILPPTPPQVPYHNHAHQPYAPSLDHRRNSWSSSGATDTPTTPFATHVDPVPTIAPEQQGLLEDRIRTDIGKHVESLLLSGPPLPRPIPAIFVAGVASLAQTLDNPTNTTNVYIRGLPPDTNDDRLYEMTCRFGSLVSHKAIMDAEHGTCKGYGFARYETYKEAENCILGLVGLKYEAGFARESFNARLKTLADPNSTNIYVSNLPRSMTEKDMQDIFAGFVVVSNRILRDADGASRGVGFARLVTILEIFCLFGIMTTTDLNHAIFVMKL